ncbi:Uncharacterized protein TCM_026150 [Theobroma cacao]|uniref:DC1 domain-containing protein n=1 Tax=Theobroma cacao TaxID=3641 RepID=A0A061F1C6_THECC|nr:Uncharacterized protein TCM_026150 [Theobroma cacao]
MSATVTILLILRRKYVDACVSHAMLVVLNVLLKARMARSTAVCNDLVVEDDTGEYYCDICEEKRNPEHHVYYCEQCTYIAHIKCVLIIEEETSSAEDISHLVCKSGESCGNMDSKALLENITEQKAEQQSEFPAPQVRPIVALIVILFSMNLVLDYQKRYNVHFIRYTNWRLHKAEISLFNAIFVVVFFAQVTLAIVVSFILTSTSIINALYPQEGPSNRVPTSMIFTIVGKMAAV